MRWDDPSIAEFLEIVWDYMRLVHPPGPSDAIPTLGSFDPMTAVRAAELWREQWAPVIIMPGGVAHRGTLLESGWGRPEAEVFGDVAVAAGVPSEAILLEREAQNTGENFTLGKALAARHGVSVGRLLVVAKPYMTRRGYATDRVAWPSRRRTLGGDDPRKGLPYKGIVAKFTFGVIPDRSEAEGKGIQTARRLPWMPFPALPKSDVSDLCHQGGTTREHPSCAGRRG